MRPRYSLLVTPLECVLPLSILISILNAPLTPLESALTSPSHLIENTATLSLLESALTRFSPATPLESALTKNTGVGGLPSWNEFTPSEAEAQLVSRRCIQVLSFHTLAHSVALFCTLQKLNSFIFKRFRTLRQKTQPPGGWILLTSHSPSQRLRASVAIPPSLDPSLPRAREQGIYLFTSHESPVANRCIISPR